MKFEHYYDKYHKVIKERAIETIKLIPKDVNTILDVGCGDGLLTNIINNKFYVVGCDINFAELKYIKKDKLQTTVALLPFRNNQFDLVLSTELIEHLKVNFYNKALKELERIAKKYILLSVPYNENLEKSFAKCPMCGCIFHGSYHIRSFNLNNLKNLFNKFELVEYKKLGRIDIEDKTTKFELFIRHHIAGDYIYYSDKTYCPVCNYKIDKRPPKSILSYFCSIIRRLQRVFLYFTKEPVWIVVLYKKTNNSE